MYAFSVSVSLFALQLHTFYFLLVLATMGVYQSVNYTQWGIRVKVFIVALFIYFVWEYEQVFQGIFDTVFWPLSPILAESNGRSV